MSAARSWAERAPEEEGASQSVEARAAAADQWLAEKISGLNVILRVPTQLLLRQINGALQGWITRELEERLLPLYEGRVDASELTSSQAE